jgi:hypothetical protein
MGKQIKIDENGKFGFVPHVAHHDNSIGFQVLFTGNLKYQSMILGKVNMASSKCPFCKHLPKEWERDHEPGELWCLQTMEETRKQCDNGTLDDIPDNRRGCVKEPIYNIALWFFVIPLLHCMIGMFNDAIMDFLTGWTSDASKFPKMSSLHLERCSKPNLVSREQNLMFAFGWN